MSTPVGTSANSLEAAPTQSILIVEDDPITARYLELGLKRMAYTRVRTANSSEMALELARVEVPDLALMDIQIEGGRDGIDTARLMRERFDVPVIFLTGLADDATMERARDAGPLGYLVKPVKAEDLRAALGAAFQKDALVRTGRERDCWLNGIVEAVDAALLTCNLAGCIELTNAALRQLLEISTGEILQRSFADLVNLRDLQGREIRDPHTLPIGESTGLLQRKSGEIRVSLNVGRVTDARGRALGVVIVMRPGR